MTKEQREPHPWSIEAQEKRLKQLRTDFVETMMRISALNQAAYESKR